MGLSRSKNLSSAKATCDALPDADKAPAVEFKTRPADITLEE